MRQLLLLCVGLAIIVIQVLLGAQTFFPEAFATKEDALDGLLEQKNPILDKIAPEDLAWLAANPVVTVGVDPNFYPLEMFDERGRYTGLGGDYLRLLAKMTGIDFRPVATSDWARQRPRQRGRDLARRQARGRGQGVVLARLPQGIPPRDHRRTRCDHAGGPAESGRGRGGRRARL